MKDPGWIVIDEVAGLFVATLFLPLSPWVWGVAFVAFRVFDITKPFPAGRLERLPDGWGIMADDLAAGVYANLLTHALVAAGWLTWS